MEAEPLGETLYPLGLDSRGVARTKKKKKNEEEEEEEKEKCPFSRPGRSHIPRQRKTV